VSVVSPKNEKAARAGTLTASFAMGKVYATRVVILKGIGAKELV
jgi:hypothetical protein